MPSQKQEQGALVQQVPDSGFALVASLAGMGGLIGLGQLFLGTEKITLRRAAGRALVTAGLAVAAASILIAVPGLPAIAVVGLAALTASLGTAGLERLLQRVVFKS